MDEEAALKDLVARGVKIPPWPRVLTDLRSCLDAGDVDARSISTILQRDPGIVAALYKVARSPAFSRGRGVGDRLEQVIILLGVRQTLTVVQAVALSSALSLSRRADLDAFWSWSEDIAQLAALIAGDRVSVCNIFPEQAFLAGIFRECGIPVLMQRYPDYCASLAIGAQHCWPGVFAEDQRLDTDHCVIGYLVARHWKLPDFIASSLLYHNELPTEELGAVRSMVCILQMASHCLALIKQRPSTLWTMLGNEVMAELGLHPDDADDYFDDICTRFGAMV